MYPTDGMKPSDRARIGTQGFLICTNAPAGVNILGKRLVDCGLLNVVGTYEFDLDVAGIASLDVMLMPSAVVGVFAPSLVSTYANKRKPKTAAAAPANFANATLQTLTIALKGERLARVAFTIPGGGSINFDPTAGAADPQGATPAAQAEYNGK